MAGEGIDIGHVLNLPAARAGPANAARKRDDQAAMSALIGPDFQQVRRHDAVEPRPIGKGMRRQAARAML